MPASCSCLTAIGPRKEKTPTAGCVSLVPATGMPRLRQASRSTSVPRYSQLSYISGITADGFSWPTMAASMGRTWPLLVTMSAAPATPGVFAGISSIRSATPASRASSAVPAASSCGVA